MFILGHGLADRDNKAINLAVALGGGSIMSTDGAGPVDAKGNLDPSLLHDVSANAKIFGVFG